MFALVSLQETFPTSWLWSLNFFFFTFWRNRANWTKHELQVRKVQCNLQAGANAGLHKWLVNRERVLRRETAYGRGAGVHHWWFKDQEAGGRLWKDNRRVARWEKALKYCTCQRREFCFGSFIKSRRLLKLRLQAISLRLSACQSHVHSVCPQNTLKQLFQTQVQVPQVSGKLFETLFTLRTCHTVKDFVKITCLLVWFPIFLYRVRMLSPVYSVLSYHNPNQNVNYSLIFTVTPHT